jgi:subtilisin family serine protease
MGLIPVDRRLPARIPPRISLWANLQHLTEIVMFVLGPPGVRPSAVSASTAARGDLLVRWSLVSLLLGCGAGAVFAGPLGEATSLVAGASAAGPQSPFAGASAAGSPSHFAGAPIAEAPSPFAGTSTTEASSPDGDVLHPVLRSILDGSPGDREVVAWVLFRDKGLDPQAEALSLDRVRREMPEAVRARRERVDGVPLVDARDLPVHEPYIEAVIEMGGRLRHPTRWLNGGSFVLALDALRSVARLPFVREIRPVARGRTSDERIAGPVLQGPGGGDPPAEGLDYGAGLPYGPSRGQLEELNIPPVHAAGFSGAGVPVMMLDTGFFKDHDAFANTALVSEWDFVFEDGNTQNEDGDHDSSHNHGTSSWSVCGGYDPGIIIGPAYGAPFHLAKTEDIRSETQAEEDNYVAALERADSLGVWVTSASLTYFAFDDGFSYEYEDLDGDTAVITIAVDIAASKGILCVNSIGNYGDEPGSLRTPADADTIIAAGAVDSLGTIALFSSRGPTYDGRIKPELVARGLDVWLAIASEGPDGYSGGNGTSFSCPLLSGAAALVLEAHPEWGPVDVIEALKASGDWAHDPNNDYGWGRPNVLEAIFSETPVFPLPFSLVSPDDGAEPVLPLTLVWEASQDLDSGVPPLYEVWIREAGTEDEPFVHEGLSDTSFVVPDILYPGVVYEWRVFAVDGDQHERPSREIRTFTMPSGAGVGDSPLVPASLRLALWPNPSPSGLSLRLSGSRWLDSPKTVTVLSVTGRAVVRRVMRGSAWSWDGRDDTGRAVPSGIYWVRVDDGAGVARSSMWVKLR